MKCMSCKTGDMKIEDILADIASDDEVAAIAEARESLKKDGHVSFDDIDWD